MIEYFGHELEISEDIILKEYTAHIFKCTKCNINLISYFTPPIRFRKITNNPSPGEIIKHEYKDYEFTCDETIVKELLE